MPQDAGSSCPITIPQQKRKIKGPRNYLRVKRESMMWKKKWLHVYKCVPKQRTLSKCSGSQWFPEKYSPFWTSPAPCPRKIVIQPLKLKKKKNPEGRDLSFAGESTWASEPLQWLRIGSKGLQEKPNGKPQNTDSTLCYSLALWAWIHHSTHLCLSFLICRIKT